MAKKRSSKYDFFQGVTSSPALEKKQKRKKIWRWIKIIIFSFLGVITLTGLIQTFIFPTSTSVGSGTEFYENKNSIAPNVATFEKANAAIDSESQQTFYTYNQNNQIVLNNANASDIATQIDRDNSKEIYGNFNTRTSAVRILNFDDQSIGVFKKNNQFLVKNTLQEGYSSLYENDFQNIPFFITSLTSENEQILGVSTDISFIENVEIQTNEGITSGFQLKDPLLIEINKNTFNAEEFSKVQKANLIFSLDILQSLFLETIKLEAYNSSNFSNNTIGFTQVPENISFLEWISTLGNGTILNQKQRDLLIAYNLAISSYLNISNFRIKINSTGSSIVFSQNLGQAIVSTVDSSGNSTTLPNSTSQSAFTSWGQAWSYGPWFGLFVYPISFMTLGIVNGFANPLEVSIAGGNVELASFGIIMAIFIVVFIIRILSFLLTSKSIFAQVKMQELGPKRAKIEAKYAPFKGNKEMDRRKAQEMQQLYKKNNIKISSTFISTLISMPIFFAMFKIIQGVPIIKITSFAGINFASTSWQQLFGGNFFYLPILIVVFLVQLVSQFIPRLLTNKRMKERTNIIEKAALKKTNRTQNIIAFVFAFFGLILPAGVQIYWIAGGIFTILQSLFVHYFQRTNLYRNKLRKFI